jgi:hypothetical protein
VFGAIKVDFEFQAGGSIKVGAHRRDGLVC